MRLRCWLQVLCSLARAAGTAGLLNLSIPDPLTGLPNCREFEERIGQEVARALRCKTLSLLMMDVILFKPVQDPYGHQAGDEALEDGGQCLERQRRLATGSLR